MNIHFFLYIKWSSLVNQTKKVFRFRHCLKSELFGNGTLFRLSEILTFRFRTFTVYVLFPPLYFKVQRIRQHEQCALQIPSHQSRRKTADLVRKKFGAKISGPSSGLLPTHGPGPPEPRRKGQRSCASCRASRIW